MIEVVIDFNEISKSDNVSSNELVLYLSKKLGLPYKNRIGKWDAFKDNFWPLGYKEWTEYKKDEWESYEKYLYEKELDSQYGLKNENGVRDDLKKF